MDKGGIMTPKYQIGDIITNGVCHYLVEDIDKSRYYGVCYLLRRLEDNETFPSFVSVTDRALELSKVA